jgi:hypothetical protein
MAEPGYSAGTQYCFDRKLAYSRQNLAGEYYVSAQDMVLVTVLGSASPLAYPTAICG